MSLSNEFFSSILIPPRPTELALPYVEKFTNGGFEHTVEEYALLAKLEKMSDALGFIGAKYTIEGGLGFEIPIDYENEKETLYKRYNGLFCVGRFLTYSKVSIGNFVGHGSVEALCLAFDSASIYRDEFYELSEESLLHIPVLAVDSIDRTP